ncbi:hypothetical protein Tco_1356178 [Tanacetum coccineum]
MAESSSHNPSSPEITLKEEPVTHDKPKIPNLFLPADQIEFSFDEIAFTTNNEVALLYPSHPNSKYFREYTAKNLDNSKIWVSTPTGGIRGDMSITTFKNAPRVEATDGSDHSVFRWENRWPGLNNTDATILYCLVNGEYMMPAYDNEELTINPTQVFSVHNWALKPNQHEGPPFTDHMKAICNMDVLVDSQAPKTS